MNTNDLIASYVADVTSQLPRRQRADVALELRELLAEDLEARAQAAGRAPDAAMAMELLAAFGRPAEVAARYRPALVIIDPVDGRTFLRASAIGVAVLWAVGLVVVLRRPIATFSDAALALGEWSVGAALPALAWPGFLVVCFAAGAWARRRRPRTGAWKPRPAERERVNRFGYSMAMLSAACGVLLMLQPARVLDLLYGGRAAAAAYEAFAYDDEFLRVRGPLWLVLTVVSGMLHAAVMVRGRWSVLTRRIDLGLSLAICAAMIWTVAAGRVFRVESTDGLVKAILAALIVVALVDVGRKLLRGRARALTPEGLIGKATS